VLQAQTSFVSTSRESKAICGAWHHGRSCWIACLLALHGLWRIMNWTLLAGLQASSQSLPLIS